MAIYSILPSTNLRYQDIRDTLNANGGTVGNTSADANSIWSANAKINMWSRNKPVVVDAMAKITDADRVNINFGLDASTYNSLFAQPSAVEINNKVTNISHDTNGFLYKLAKGLLKYWQYNKPVAGRDWLRISDFLGYYPYAVSPLPKALSYYYAFSAAGAVNIPITTNTITDTDHNVDLTTLHIPANIINTKPPLSSLYKGLLFFKDGLTDVMWATEESVGKGHVKLINNDYVTISDKVGTWSVIAFFSTKALQLNDYTDSSQMFLLPASYEVMEITLYDAANPVKIEITTCKYVDTLRSQLHIHARVTSYAGNLPMTDIKISATGMTSEPYDWTTVYTAPDRTAPAGVAQDFDYNEQALGYVKAKFSLKINGVEYSTISNIY